MLQDQTPLHKHYPEVFFFGITKNKLALISQLEVM